MFKFSFLAGCLLLSASLFAQNKLCFKPKHAETGESLNQLIIELKNADGKSTFSSSAINNSYCFENLKSGTYSAFIYQFQEVKDLGTFVINSDTSIELQLKINSLSLNEVVVTPLKTESLASFQLNPIKRAEIYIGQELPVLLQNAPSVNAYSDNGSGMGYSSMRLRGFDQSRINLSINGVPVNDPENLGFFSNNFADILSSAQDVSVMPGVGIGNNGTSSLGGAISIATISPSDTAAMNFEGNYGFSERYSNFFNNNSANNPFFSQRNSLSFHTGNINNFKFYGRLSYASTDGFRDRSNSELSSYTFSLHYKYKKHQFQLNAWGGVQQNQLSYLGLSPADFEANPRINYLAANEKDKFRQFFYQLNHSWVINPNLVINNSVYFVKGNAPYFLVNFYGTSYSYLNLPDPVIGSDTITSSDALVNYQLNQNLLGFFSNVKYIKGKTVLSAGIHANRFISDHFMDVEQLSIWPSGFIAPHRVYFNTGYKNEISAFAKVERNWSGGRTQTFAELQLRNAQFKYRDQNPLMNGLVEDMNWFFINPKIGANIILNSKSKVSASIARAYREPTRFDYFLDDLAYGPINQSNIKPESITDFELGYKFQSKKLLIQANVFYLYLNNLIANTGQLNQFGASFTQNTGTGERYGIETQINYQIIKGLNLYHTGSIMKSIIHRYEQFYNINDSTNIPVVYENTDAALTPNIILNQGIKYQIGKFMFDFSHRFVSSQYLDNTENENLKLKSFHIFNFSTFYQVNQKLNLSLRLLNIGDKIYAPSGSVFGNAASLANDGTVIPARQAYWFVGTPFMVNFGLRINL